MNSVAMTIEHASAKPRGRPRGFDRDAALHQVMEVFRAKGYGGAQVADLTEAVGIAPPSFYAAFGSKAAAFSEAVDLYVRDVASRPMQALDAAASVRDGLRAMLEGSIDVATSTRQGGCLLILGVVDTIPEHDVARAHLLRWRRRTRRLLAARIARAVAEGDLPKASDPAQLAAFFHGVMQAISFQARDGASRAALRALIAPALAALPPPPARGRRAA